MGLIVNSTSSCVRVYSSVCRSLVFVCCAYARTTNVCARLFMHTKRARVPRVRNGGRSRNATQLAIVQASKFGAEGPNSSGSEVVL